MIEAAYDGVNHGSVDGCWVGSAGWRSGLPSGGNQYDDRLTAGLRERRRRDLLRRARSRSDRERTVARERILREPSPDALVARGVGMQSVCLLYTSDAADE